MRIDPRSGRHYPNEDWAQWRDAVVLSLKFQAARQDSLPAGVMIRFHIDYYPADKRRRDLPAMEDSIWHCLERAGIVEDDSLLVTGTWVRRTGRAPGAIINLDLEPLGAETENETEARHA